MLPQDTDWFRNQIAAPPHEWDSPTSTREKLERRAEFDRWLAEERNKVRETSRQIYEQRGRTSERNSFMNGFIVGAAVVGVMLLIIQVPMTGGI